MNTNAVVDFEQVSKSYGAVKALDDVALEIPMGQTVALLGPNGAGKSTAINLMLGLLAPSTGVVRVLGLSPHDAVAGGRVGAMLQDAGLPVTARVDELIELIRGLYPYPLPSREIIKRAGLTGLEKRSVEGLSGGEAQRVRLALALAGDPDLLFLDEPTVAMDVETRRAFWADMGTLAADGRTILFATHYLNEADEAADRIVVLVHGRVVADGSAASIKSTVAGRTVRFSLNGASSNSLAAIKDLPYVESVDISGDRVAITTDDSDAVVHELVATGLPVRDLEIAGGDLEDAFVALTKPQEVVQ